MAEPTWSLYLDDSFTHADTSVDATPKSNGGVPTTPATGAANNWYDWQGNRFRINSNQLDRAVASSGWVGTALYRGGSEAYRDQRIVVDYPAGSQPGAIYLRFNTTSSACIWFNQATSGYLGYLNAFNNFGGNTGSWTWTWNNTHTYQSDCRVWGESPTNWAFTLTDTTTSTVVVNSSGTLSSGTTSAGSVGLDGGVGGGSRVSRVRAYIGGFTLGELKPDPAAVTLANTGLVINAIVGGTAPVTLDLHRSTDPLATLGVGTLVADVSAVTPGATYTDTPPGPSGTQYYYWLRATDSTSPTPQVITSLPVPLNTKIGHVKIGLIGDSITNRIELFSAGLLAAKWAEMYPKYLFTATNCGQSASTTLEWLPGSAYHYLPDAISAFQAAGVTHVLVMLGTNDAIDSQARTPASYKANMQTICTELINAGFKVVLNAQPAYRLNYAPQSPGGYSANSYALLPQYVAKLDELVNGTTIFKGDRQAFAATAEKADTLLSDWVHPNLAGSTLLAQLWFEPLGAILGIYGSSSGGGSSVGRIFGGL